MDWTYSIAMELEGAAQVSAAEEAVTRLENAMGRLSESIEYSAQKYEEMGEATEAASARGASSMGRLIRQLGIAAALTTSFFAAMRAEAADTQLNFAVGGSGSESIEFLKQTSSDLGLSIEATKADFTNLAGAMKGTALEGEAAQKVFEGIATANAAQRHGIADSSAVVSLFSQAMQKGVIDSKLLREQMADYIPGAFGLAAEAMGVTESELQRMLDTGEVLAEEFLPKFAERIKTQFGAAAEEAANGAEAAMNRYKNSINAVQVGIGQELIPVVMKLLDGYLTPALTFLAEHVKMFTMLGLAVGGAYAAHKLYVLWTLRSVIATGAMAVAQWGLNVAMSANPIGGVIAVIGALVAGVIYAWHNFEGFRGFLYGFWEVIKETGSIIWDFFVRPFLNLGKLLIGVFTLDKDIIAQSLAESGAVLENESWKIGKRIGDAFSKGHAAGLESFGADQADAVKADAAASAFSGKPTAGRTVEPEKKKEGLTGITGRNQVKNVVINLNGNLIGELQIRAQRVNEGIDEMADMVSRKLLQVLNTANQVQ
jgi:tape measure domain-containing protein